VNEVDPKEEAWDLAVERGWMFTSDLLAFGPPPGFKATPGRPSNGRQTNYLVRIGKLARVDERAVVLRGGSKDGSVLNLDPGLRYFHVPAFRDMPPWRPQESPSIDEMAVEAYRWDGAVDGQGRRVFRFVE
jgi:hypothetical protein